MAGAPGVSGVPGGNGQSPFSGAKADGAEAVAQQFYEKLMAGEANGAEDLYSDKAKGHARSLRDGKASENVIDELKNAFTKVKFNSSQLLGGVHIVLLTESASGGQQSAQPDFGNGQRNRSRKKKTPPGMKVQFTIVSEHGKLLIKDVAVRDH